MRSLPYQGLGRPWNPCGLKAFPTFCESPGPAVPPDGGYQGSRSADIAMLSASPPIFLRWNIDSEAETKDSETPSCGPVNPHFRDRGWESCCLSLKKKLQGVPLSEKPWS